MTHVEVLLAKRYAAAYLNVHAASFTAQNLPALQSLQDFLSQNEELLVLLRLPAVPLTLKLEELKKIIHSYGIPESLVDLVRLVLARGRAELLPEVLKQIRVIYYERHKIMSCVIATSHPVTPSALEIIQRFITRKTGWNIIYTHVVDPSLIAGIRVSSDSILWEYSLRKQLNNVSLSLIR